MNQPAVAALPSASGAPSMRSGLSTCSNGSVSFSGVITPTKYVRRPTAWSHTRGRQRRDGGAPVGNSSRISTPAKNATAQIFAPTNAAYGPPGREPGSAMRAWKPYAVGEHRDGEDDPDDAEEPADGVSGSSPRDERSDGGERDGRNEHDGVVPAVVDHAEGERARGEREGQAERHPGEHRAHVGRTECRDQRILRQGARARQPRGREASHGWKAAAATVPGPLRRP